MRPRNPNYRTRKRLKKDRELLARACRGDRPRDVVPVPCAFRPRGKCRLRASVKWALIPKDRFMPLQPPLADPTIQRYRDYARQRQMTLGDMLLENRIVFLEGVINDAAANLGRHEISLPPV